LMDEHLAGRDWLVGSHMTLADICLYAYTHVAEEEEFGLTARPNLSAWLERVAAQSGYIGFDD